MLDGIIRPTKYTVLPNINEKILQIWPDKQISSDRVEDQLMYIPPHYKYENSTMKTILLYNNINSWTANVKQDEFLSKHCPVNRCTITTGRMKAPKVDAILFRNKFWYPNYNKPMKQVILTKTIISIYFNKFNITFVIILNP